MQLEIDGDDSFCTRKLYKLHYVAFNLQALPPISVIKFTP